MGRDRRRERAVRRGGGPATRGGGVATRRRLRQTRAAVSRAGRRAPAQERLAGVASDALVATAEKGFMGGIRTVDDLVRVESVARAKAEAARLNRGRMTRRASICSGAPRTRGRRWRRNRPVTARGRSSRRRSGTGFTNGGGRRAQAVEPPRRDRPRCRPPPSRRCGAATATNPSRLPASASKSPRSALDFDPTAAVPRGTRLFRRTSRRRARSRDSAAAESSRRRAATRSPFTGGSNPPTTGFDAPAGSRREPGWRRSRRSSAANATRARWPRRNFSGSVWKLTRRTRRLGTTSRRSDASSSRRRRSSRVSRPRSSGR